MGGERYAPDVAYISASQQPELAREGYNPNPPELAVEVVSSDRPDELHQLRIKIINYFAVGTGVWVVKPNDQLIEVHQPGQAVKIYRKDDTLDDGDVLPGFRLKVAEIFN